jgi:hypothetical protein
MMIASMLKLMIICLTTFWIASIFHNALNGDGTSFAMVSGVSVQRKNM